MLAWPRMANTSRSPASGWSSRAPRPRRSSSADGNGPHRNSVGVQDRDETRSPDGRDARAGPHRPEFAAGSEMCMSSVLGRAYQTQHPTLAHELVQGTCPVLRDRWRTRTANSPCRSGAVPRHGDTPAAPPCAMTRTVRAVHVSIGPWRVRGQAMSSARRKVGDMVVAGVRGDDRADFVGARGE